MIGRYKMESLLLRFAKKREARKKELEKERKQIDKAYNKLDIIEKIALKEELKKYDSKINLFFLTLPFKVAIYLAIFGLPMLVFGINLLEPLATVVRTIFSLIPLLIVMFFASVLGEILSSIDIKKSVSKKLLLKK